MKLSATEQESLVTLMTHLFSDIRVLEQTYELLVGDGDFRPRIEYFHDAVRAFTSQDTSSFEKGGRLTVALLAYDVESLRAIYAKPLAPFAPHTHIFSPSTDVIVKRSQELDVMRKRPDRGVRERLSELYQRYAVLFSALLKPCADRDYQEKVDAMNQEIEDLHTLIVQYNQYLKGINTLAKIMETITHMEDEALRAELLKFHHQQKYKRKDYLHTLIDFLKATLKKKNGDINQIDQHHLNYVMAQLGIYEVSKDMVKTMAKEGLNLVGKFVESSIAASKRDMGR